MTGLLGKSHFVGVRSIKFRDPTSPLPDACERWEKSSLAIAVGAYIVLLCVDSVTFAFPVLAGYVLVIAYATARVPVAIPLIMCVIATVFAGIEWMIAGGQPDLLTATFSALNRGSVLGLAVFLVRRFATNRTQEFFQSRHDQLTGLPNRRLLLERLEAELNRNRRTGKPLTVAFLDCDNFKVINDQNGHAAGDRVLQQIAGSLSTAIRDYDLVARWGGDEFVLLFPETDAEQAHSITWRLLPQLETELQAAGNPITFCAGVVTVFDSEQAAGNLIRRADEAMYVAKRSSQTNVTYLVLEADAVATSVD